MSTTFACDTCYDTRTIDQGGREIACPDCVTTPLVTLKLTGLAHGLGEDGKFYSTAVAWTASTITFAATSKARIREDVAQVRRQAEQAARLAGHRGRNSISSGAIAIDKRVRDRLLLIPTPKPATI